MLENEKNNVSGVSPSPIPAEGRITVSDRQADITLRFLEEHDYEFGPVTPEKERKLLWKLYLYVLGIAIVTNLVLFVSVYSVGRRRAKQIKY